MEPERHGSVLLDLEEESGGHGWYKLDEMFTEQESASNKVGASTDPFCGIWSIFRVDYGPHYWGLHEFLPFLFESFAPNWQLAISALIIQHSI